mgnify:CR=1 FL=1
MSYRFGSSQGFRIDLGLQSDVTDVTLKNTHALILIRLVDVIDDVLGTSCAYACLFKVHWLAVIESNHELSDSGRATLKFKEHLSQNYKMLLGQLIIQIA